MFNHHNLSLGVFSINLANAARVYIQPAEFRSVFLMHTFFSRSSQMPRMADPLRLPESSGVRVLDRVEQ